MITELFNDREHIVSIQSYKNLHDNFALLIECARGDYLLTVEKVKRLMQDMKPKLREIIRRYNASGNGSDMHRTDDDSNDERDVMMNEATYGRFNHDWSLKHVESMHNQELLLKDGNDQSSFLKYESSALLYWWHVMDEYNLFFFTCAILDINNSASSTSIPNAVSRHGRNDSKKVTGAVNAQQVATKELNDNVRKISQSMVTIAQLFRE
jgi:hypothetical protein